jgi:hypothetical protein
MKCSVDDCQNASCGPRWEDKQYCSRHYNDLRTKDFEAEWASWDGHTFPTYKLRRYLGMFVDEKCTLRNGLMTRARLRDRGFNFKKEDSCVVFEITRHPGAFKSKNPFIVNRIVERWRVSLLDRIAEFIDNRPWTTDDPD